MAIAIAQFTITDLNDGINGSNGSNGAPGKGISSTSVTYQASSSGTTTPTGTWLSSPPTVSANQFLWTRIIFTYTDTTTVTSYSIGKMGANGTNGTNGSPGATGVSITGVVVEYYLSTSATALAGGAWSTTAPVWAENKFMWSRVVTSYSLGSPTTSTPVCITGSKGTTGTDGSNGTNGNPGATGKGITSVTSEYYLSTSSTGLVGGSWTVTPATYITGRYMWHRSKIVYKDPVTTEYTTAVVDKAWEQIVGLKSSVSYLDSNTTPTAIVNAFITEYGLSDAKTITKGIVTLNRDGVVVGNSISAIQAHMLYNGFEVRDNSEIISTFGESGAVIPILDVGIIKSNDIIKPIGTQTVYVGGLGYSSIQEALDSVFSGGKRFINGVVTIEIGADMSETVNIVNLVGGKILIKLINSAVLYGDIYVGYCSSKVVIKAEGYRSSIVSKRQQAIHVVGSRTVEVQSLNLSGNAISVYATEGSTVYLDDVDLGNTYYGLIAQEGSIIHTNDCRGSSPGAAMETRTSGVIFTHGNIPQGQHIGHIFKHLPVVVASGFGVPTVVSKTFKSVFTVAILDTLSNNLSVSSYYGANAAQNKWPGNLSYSVGRIRMDDSIKKFIAGATSSSVRMRLRRKNTSHGPTSAISPTPSFSMGSMSGAVRGGWSGWGNISTALFGDSVELKFGANAQSNYAIWDAIEIEVTITKNV